MVYFGLKATIIFKVGAVRFELTTFWTRIVFRPLIDVFRNSKICGLYAFLCLSSLAHMRFLPSRVTSFHTALHNVLNPTKPPTQTNAGLTHLLQFDR